MAFILNIDTSLENASVSVAKDGIIIASATNQIQKEHASFLHVTIADLVKDAHITLATLDAIAVTEGPGSYTGLRVGMASAKGLSYALNKPFITIGTLDAMAYAVITAEEEDVFYAPMIDARRLEVYTAVYDKNLEKILVPTALVLDENSYKSLLNERKIFFSGNGITKWKAINTSTRADFSNVTDITSSIAVLAYNKFLLKDFTNIAHSQPLYIKEFYDGK